MSKTYLTCTHRPPVQVSSASAKFMIGILCAEYGVPEISYRMESHGIVNKVVKDVVSTKGVLFDFDAFLNRDPAAI
jgi:hypothetical protein